MDRWWSWTTADGHERIQNEANRQKHRLGILCWQVYGEILEAYSAHYPSPEDAAAIGKDFPHKKDELTKSALTSKLKAIRRKYRQAVDNKEATTLLYAMFVYNARREDWIQENDESVFENFRIRPSTRIRIRIG